MANKPLCNPVFIDTSLDTHFVTIVSISDKVSDLKKKIINEHPLCFPEMGDIKILSLKVERKGCLYHLPDSMNARSVFQSVDETWFIKVDASVAGKENSNGCANGVNLLLDAHPEKKLLSSDVAVDNRQLSVDVAGGDIVKGLEIGGEGSGGGNSKVVESLDADDFDKENEIERTPVGGRESRSRNELSDVQGNLKSETVLETGSHTKNKHNSKKKRKHALNEDFSVPKGRKNESRREIVESVTSHNDAMENGHVVGGTSSQVQGTAVANTEGTGKLGNHVKRKSDKSRRVSVDVHCDKSVEATLQSEHVAKKKRKTEEEKDCDDDVLKKNGTLVAASNKEMIEPSPVSQHPVVDKQNNENPTETLEDVHLQLAGSSSGKKKKKKQPKHTLNKEIDAVPSSERDVEGESSGLGINPKDLGEEPNGDLVPVQHVRGGISSEPGAVSMKEKLGDHFPELNRRTSSKEINMSNSNASNVEGRHDPCRTGIASDTRNMEVSKHHPAINVEGSQHLGVRESDNTEKEIEVSRYENMILGDHQNHVVYQTNGVEEEQNLTLNFSSRTEKYKPSAVDELASKTKEVAVTSKLFEASETVDPSKSSKKRKKSKKLMELGNGTPSTSVIEHVEGFVSGTSPTKPHKAAIGDHSGDNVKKEETNASPKGRKEVSEMETINSSKTEKYKPSAVDELASKTKEVAVTSKLLEARETVDPSNSPKKRKKSKKTMELGNGTPTTSVTEHVEGFVSGTSRTKPYKASIGDHSGDNVNKEESNASPNEGKEVLETETSSSLLATEKEIDDVIWNAVKSVQQIGQGSAENMDGKSRKKSRKKRTSDAKDLKESKNENEKVSAPSADNNMSEVEYSFNDPLFSQSSQGQPRKPNSNSERRCLEAVFNGSPSKSGHANEGTGNLEVSCESSGINFNNYFVPSQQSNKFVGSDQVLVDGATKATEADGEMKADKNKKKVGARSHGPSPDLQNPHSLTENHGVRAKPLKGSDGGVKALPSRESDKLDFVPEKTRSIAGMPSATSTHGKSKRAATSASSESFKDISFLNRRVNGRQTHEDYNLMNSRKKSTIKAGEVVNGPQHKKSLLGVSDSIFKNVTDEASSTEVDTSDASTRTPSEKSLPSDYSDGESNADFNSSQNGSDSWKRKDGRRKTIRKPMSSGMTLDTILRSSSRYKKAKLTASQSQLEETESQPVEFVPDSQANP